MASAGVAGFSVAVLSCALADRLAIAKIDARASREKEREEIFIGTNLPDAERLSTYEAVLHNGDLALVRSRLAFSFAAMRILLVNDDGIDAPGLAALEAACSETFSGVALELYVVAPSSEASQIGHRVTTDEPIAVETRAERRFAVAGTPADCTRLALTRLMPNRPDMVLSGINAGGNLGQDIVISGTVAAAREAAYHGVPAIAVSHYLRADVERCWETAARRTASVLQKLLREDLADGEFFNVNLPHLEKCAAEPEIIETLPERAPMLIGYDKTAAGYRYNSRYADRPQSSVNADVAVCFGGNISLSRLKV